MNLAELLVRFTADVSGFSAGASAVQNMLSNMGSAAQDTGQSFLGSLTSGVSSAYEHVVSFGESIGHTVESITEMKFAGFQMVQGLVSADAEMEQTQIAFGTLLHSSTAAGEYLKNLWNFAAHTPFQFKDLAQASQQMIATGFSAKQTIPMLTDMGDALSAMGRTDPGSLMQIVSIFDRMQAAGKVNARDMMEFTFMGIPGWKMLADAMHLTVAQVQELSMKGKLMSKDAIPELEAGLEKTFGGSMAKQALTFNGLLTTVKDNLQSAWRTVSGPLFDAAKGALVAFGDLVASDKFQNFAKVVAGGIGGAFDLIGKLGGNLIKIFQGLDFTDLSDNFHTFLSIFINAGTWIQSFFTTVTKGGAAFQPLIGAVRSLMQGGLELLAHVLDQVNVALSAVWVGITDGSGPLGFLKGTFQQVASIIGGQVSEDFRFFGQLAQQIGNWVMTTLWPALQQLLPPLMSIAQNIMTNLVPALAKLWTIGQNVGQIIMSVLVSAIETILPPIIHLGTFVGTTLAGAFQLISPVVNAVAGALAGLASWLNQSGVGAAILKAVLIALSIPIGILVIGFIALKVQALVGLIMTLPAVIAGFIGGAGAAWGMATAVIALTWPILAVIAVIAAVVLAIQHWGQICDWITGKQEQMRIQTEINNEKMKINTVQKREEQAQGSIKALEKERQGVLEQLKNCHNEEERQRLENKLKSIQLQEEKEKAIVQSAEREKKQRLAHLKELEQQEAEARKNIFQKAWDAISGFFERIGGAIGGWVGGIFSNLGTAVHNGLTAVGNFFTQKWNDITNGVKSWDDALKKAVATVFQGILNAIEAPFKKIGELFTWLYNHNYYIKALCDGIKNFFEGAINWVRDQWQRFTGWLGNVWQTLQTTAQNIWKGIHDDIVQPMLDLLNWMNDQWNKFTNWLGQQWQKLQNLGKSVWKGIHDDILQPVQNLLNWLNNQWSRFTGWLGQQWDKLKGFAQTAWNNVVGVFKGVWDQITAPLNTLWNNFKSWFGNLAGQALQWGKNLIQGFINGIQNMLGGVGQAAQNVMNTIKNFLGFHSPAKEGPGTELDLWPKNMMKSYAQGLENALPMLKSTLNLVMQPVSSALGGTGLAPTPYRPAPGNTNSTTNTQTPSIHNHIYIDGREMTNSIMKKVVTEMRSGSYGRGGF